MANTLKVTILLLMITSVVIYACKNKDNTSIPEKYGEQKAWLHTNGGAYANETISIDFEGEKLTGKLDWENVTQKTANNGDFFYIPFKFTFRGKFSTNIIPSNFKDFASASSFSLVLTKEGDKFMAALQTVAYRPTDSFSALENYYNLDGVWINSFYYDSTYRSKNIYLSAGNTRQNQLAPSCTDYVITTYVQVCTYTGGTLNNVTCTVKPVKSNFSTCTGYDATGADLSGVITGYTGSIAYPPSLTGVTNGNGIKTPSITYLPPLSSSIKEVADLMDSACFKSVLNMLIGDGSNPRLLCNNITNLIKNTFHDPSTNLKIRFYQGHGMPISTLGKTTINPDQPDPVTGKRTFWVTVTINEYGLRSASQEMIAATLAHEMLHAYFDGQTYLATQQIPTGVNNPEAELLQHIEMVQTYIDEIKETLQEVFPGLPSKDAYALALAGLDDVSKVNPTMYSQILTKNGLTDAFVQSTNLDYLWGDKGIVCPKGFGNALF